MNRTRTLLIIGVFMLSLAVLAALEFRVQDEPPSEGQMVTGSLSKDMPLFPSCLPWAIRKGIRAEFWFLSTTGRCAACGPA